MSAGDARNLQARSPLCSDSNYFMNKAKARNILLVLGTWSASGILALLFAFLIPISVVTFRGDFGAVLLWVWFGVPHLLAAIVAANTLVWVTDTRKPLSWLFGLSALFFYSESMQAWRQLRRMPEPRSVPDYIGIAIAAIIPAFTCLAIGIWWKKRLDGKVPD